MALEANDINDGTILAETSIVASKQGKIKFKIVLPNGSPLESEWLDPDKKREAMFIWLATVKQRIVDLGLREEAEVRRQVLEQAAKEKREREERERALLQEQTSSTGPVLLPSADTAGVAMPMPGQVIPVPSAPAVSTQALPASPDPAAFAAAQLKALVAQTAQLESQLAQVRQQLVMWQTIVATFNGANNKNEKPIPEASNEA